MSFHPMGLRAKLVLIFVFIKVVPLVLLAWLAWSAALHLGETLRTRAAGMADNMVGTIRQVGDKVTSDAIAALDDRSREAIERLTTDTAKNVASFLYDRDADVLLAAKLPLQEAAFQAFMANRTRLNCSHGTWKLADNGKKWEPIEKTGAEQQNAADPVKALPDNAKAFHARAPEYSGKCASKPLYTEISFIDTRGHEQIKAVSGDLMPRERHDVTRQANTFVKAENYWPQLKQLKPGEIYVSDVIGAYVGSHVIGTYTPDSAKKANIAFEPEKSAYAGTENPVGRRFRGIVRWASPVVKQGKIIGYVTLALDHDHIRQFTDRIVPTDSRYTSIIDAIDGNYAFIWDHNSRAIAHPRDYMIPGFDPASGKEIVPWLDEETYKAWKDSRQEWAVFSHTLKPFNHQSLTRKPAPEMQRAGTLGLDCRYLNFSPQCAGWNQLTEKGGSGSFEILFSGLRKLTTAAAIPYYTGQYGRSPQGFGFVTIGANVDDFHRAAMTSAQQINKTIQEKDRAFRRARQGLLDVVRASMSEMASTLTGSTAAMIVIIIGIAFWMANFLVRQIAVLTEGIECFEAGNLSQRFKVPSHDEMGQLAEALNRMANAVQESFLRSEEARTKAEGANLMKSEFLAAVSHELRTPLNGILGFTELLEMDLKDPLQREHLATIKSSGKHLQSVVNDLLDMAKAESGKMILHPEPFELGSFMNEVIGVHYGHAQGKGLVLALNLAEDLPEMISTDSLRLRQTLNNLINNAIKYTDDGSVLLRVTRHENMIHIAVIDTGCGIAPEDQEAAFEKFGGVGGKVQRDKGGTGLGLSLVRKLVTLMGGKISVESVLGKGSTFTLIIPSHHPDCPVAYDPNKA